MVSSLEWVHNEEKSEFLNSAHCTSEVSQYPSRTILELGPNKGYF